MNIVVALALILLLPYLGFFTGLRHLRPLPQRTMAALFAGAAGTVILLWPQESPPLPALWPPDAAFTVQFAGWIGLVVGAIARLRLDQRSR